VKVSTLSRHLRPAVAIVDPRLTLSCPRRATADSGIDALTHAIEAFTAVDYTDLDAPPSEPFPYSGRSPMGDILAAEAISLVGKHLEACVHQPENLIAREGMALAATLAGLAFSNCAVAVVHALEYPIGAAVHVSHGAGNGLLLPYVMEFNRPVRESKFARIAALLGAKTEGLTDAEAAVAAIREVERLRHAIGIPGRLREIGVQREQLPGFAKKSFEIKRLMRLNPRPPTEQDLLSILERAF
jgi:alcohol dehydrogenase class IV